LHIVNQIDPVELLMY